VSRDVVGGEPKVLPRGGGGRPCAAASQEGGRGSLDMGT
jgi:hypothetical protein